MGNKFRIDVERKAYDTKMRVRINVDINVPCTDENSKTVTSVIDELKTLVDSDEKD